MSNLGEYVKKATEGKSELAEVMARRKSAKAQELEDLEFDALILEKKNKIREASPNELDYKQIRNSSASLFAGLSSAQIKEILGSLTQEEMDKFLYMSGRMDPNNLANIRGLPRESNTETKNMLEALKIGLEAGRKNESSSKDLIDAFKAGTEVNKAQQVPVQPQQDPMQVYKMVQEMIQPYREDANNQAKQLSEFRLKEVESRIVDPNAYIKNIKSVAADLGFTPSGATNEYTLKKEEMAQTERLENRKMDFEMKKNDREEAKDNTTTELFKEGIKVLSSPAFGGFMKNVGEGVRDKLRGSVASNSNTSQAPSAQFEKVKCPNCNGDFPANIQLPTLQCPLCGAQLLHNEPAPSQDMPKDQPPSDSQQQSSPIPAQEQPTPAATDQTVEVEAIAEPTKQ